MPPRRNHPGNIEERGGTFRVRLCVAGERHRFTLDPERYPTREDAEAFARRTYDKLRRKNGRGLPGPMPFSELLTRYRDECLPVLSSNSQKTYRASLKAFETFFVRRGGDPPVHEIRPGHVRSFMSWRRTRSPDGRGRERPLSTRGIAKDRAVLGILFSFGEEQEIVESNPVRKVRPPKGDSREPLILTDNQYEALISACEGRPMLGVYLLTLGEAGLRCDSEALWLRWADLDLEKGLLTVESVRKGRRTKSGKMRKVPITRRLREAMRDHAAAYRLRKYRGVRTPWVFHHEVDRRHAKAGARLGGLRRAFKGAVKRTKLPQDLNQHDLRHRRVTTWLAEGKPAHLVQKAMGHADLRTTMAYEHLVAEDLLQLVREPSDEELRSLTSS